MKKIFFIWMLSFAWSMEKDSLQESKKLETMQEESLENLRFLNQRIRKLNCKKINTIFIKQMSENLKDLNKYLGENLSLVKKCSSYNQFCILSSKMRCVIGEKIIKIANDAIENTTDLNKKNSFIMLSTGEFLKKWQEADEEIQKQFEASTQCSSVVCEKNFSEDGDDWEDLFMDRAKVLQKTIDFDIGTRTLVFRMEKLTSEQIEDVKDFIRDITRSGYSDYHVSFLSFDAFHFIEEIKSICDYLTIDGNFLEKNQKIDFGSVKYLELLNMKNKWKIFQDFSFPQLTSLSVLKNSCSDDFFLPHLSNLKKLTLELDTNDGDLCKLIFDEIYSKAPALEKLELPYCQISKKAIENLKLSYCQIPKTDAVFLNILKNKNVLKNVKIYENEHGLNLLAEKEFEIQDGDEEFYY